jgi:hypothetical protein
MVEHRLYCSSFFQEEEAEMPLGKVLIVVVVDPYELKGKVLCRRSVTARQPLPELTTTLRGFRGHVYNRADD